MLTGLCELVGQSASFIIAWEAQLSLPVKQVPVFLLLGCEGKDYGPCSQQVECQFPRPQKGPWLIFQILSSAYPLAQISDSN